MGVMQVKSTPSIVKIDIRSLNKHSIAKIHAEESKKLVTAIAMSN